MVNIIPETNFWEAPRMSNNLSLKKGVNSFEDPFGKCKEEYVLMKSLKENKRIVRDTNF